MVTAATLSPHAPASALAIARVEPFSTHHWHDRLATGVLFGGHPEVSWGDVASGLAERAGLVDAVMLTGEEPTNQPGLLAAIHEARGLGYAVAITTTGARPSRLAEVLPHLDWVTLELDAAHGNDVCAWSSLELIMRSGVGYEVVIAVEPAAHTRQDVLDSVRAVIHRGAHAPVLTGRRLYDVIRLADLPDLERR